MPKRDKIMKIHLHIFRSTKRNNCKNIVAVSTTVSKTGNLSTYLFILGYPSHNSSIYDTIKYHTQRVDTLIPIWGQISDDPIELFVLRFHSFNCIEKGADFNLKRHQKGNVIWKKIREHIFRKGTWLSFMCVPRLYSVEENLTLNLPIADKPCNWYFGHPTVRGTQQAIDTDVATSYKKQAT